MTAMNARGIRAAQVGFLANALLATVKLVAGVLGNSYALVADAIESIADAVRYRMMAHSGTIRKVVSSLTQTHLS